MSQSKESTSVIDDLESLHDLIDLNLAYLQVNVQDSKLFQPPPPLPTKAEKSAMEKIKRQISNLSDFRTSITTSFHDIATKHTRMKTELSHLQASEKVKKRRIDTLLTQLEERKKLTPPALTLPPAPSTSSWNGKSAPSMPTPKAAAEDLFSDLGDDDLTQASDTILTQQSLNLTAEFNPTASSSPISTVDDDQVVTAEEAIDMF